MAKFNEHRKIVAHLEKIKPELNKAVDAMGVIAVNHFTNSFREQGFTDEAFTAWKPRKRTERSRLGKRAILVKSGRLRRSLRSRRKGSLSVVISTDVPYAQVHNDGLRSGRGKGFMMPKRQFVGYSGKMNRKIIAKFDAQLKRIFNK